MESKANYTIVGLTVLILIAGLLSASIWLSIGFDQKIYKTYIVYMGEAISGLSDDAPIKFNGVKVGYISKIELNQDDPQQVKLELKIVANTPITSSTQATLIAQGITGTTYLGLNATSASLEPLQTAPNEAYPVIPYKPSFFNQLEHTIDDLALGFNRVFTDKNANHITKTLANLEDVTDVIIQNDKNINQALRDLPDVMKELKTSVQKFSRMSEHLSTAGKQVTDTMKTGKDSIEQFSQQTLPPANLLLKKLDSIAANLEVLSNDVRVNPSVIIRGSTPQPPGPGE